MAKHQLSTLPSRVAIRGHQTKLVGSWLSMKERSQALPKAQPRWVKMAFTTNSQKGRVVKKVCALGVGEHFHTPFSKPWKPVP